MIAFSDQLSVFAKKAEAAIDQTVREAVYQCGLSLVRLSPVDTSRFQSNWRYGLMTPDNFFDENARNVRFVHDMGDAPKAASRFVHFITNAAPYGPALERGHSQQAPQGMVVLTTLAFEDIVSNAARKARAGEIAS